MSSYQGLRKLDDLVFLVNKPIIGKKGVHFQKLLKDWSSIIGEEIANYTIPTRITTSRTKSIPENILFIATNNTALSAELVYQLGVIKEQLNLYFGYEYIHQIKITQASFSSKKQIEEDKIPELSQEQKDKSKQLVASYDAEDKLKDILIQLAELIVGQK